MIVGIGLGIIGLILIYFEFFVPGGILAIIGGVFIILGLALFVWKQTHLFFVVIYIILLILALIFTIRYALWKLKQKPALFSSDDQEGYIASKFDDTLIGSQGQALTDLKPSGHIKIDGEQYQAVSESSYIKKGETIKVISGEGARLVVKKI